jgi:hypothetical protein
MNARVLPLHLPFLLGTGTISSFEKDLIKELKAWYIIYQAFF